MNHLKIVSLLKFETFEKGEIFIQTKKRNEKRVFYSKWNL